MSGGYIAPLLLFGLLACSKVQLVPVTVTSVELGSLSSSSLSVRLVGQVEYDTWNASADIRLLSSFPPDCRLLLTVVKTTSLRVKV